MPNLRQRAAAAIQAWRGAPVAGASSAEAPARHIQSVEQLIAILQQSGQDSLSGLSVKLSDAEARRFFVGWQYAAACVIAESVMQAAWTVQARDSEGWSDVPEAAAWRFLERGNPLMSGRLVLYYTALDLSMIGKNWWYLAPNKLGEPAEPWPLVGDIKPRLDKDGLPKGWHQTTSDARGGRMEKDYEADEVLFLRWPEPGKLLDGMGAFQAAASAIKLHWQITESEWAAMKQGLWPSALLKLPIQDAEKRDQVMDEFNAKYSGARGTGKAIGVSQNVDVQWPPVKPREMGYELSSERRRDEILALLRVPAAILGLSKDVNRASAEALELIFNKWTIKPKLALIEDQINCGLIWPHWGEDLRMKYADPVPANEEALLRRDEMELRTFVISGNDYLQRRGQEPRPWGDSPLVPIGVMPLGSSGGSGEGEGEQRLQTQARRRALERRVIAGDIMEARMEFQAAVKTRAGRYFKALGKRVAEAWDETADKQRQDVRRTLRLPPAVDKILDPQDMAKMLSASMSSLNREGIFIGGSLDRGLSGLASSTQWSRTHEAIDRYVAAYGPAHYGQVAQVTRDKMMSIVAEGIKENATWDELKARVVSEFGEMAESRAANIATTETTKLYGSGGQAFRESAGIEKKMWVTSFVNSRDTHIQADGQVVGNEEYFQVGADKMQFPGDGKLAEENCNCNCAVISVLK